MFFSKEVEGVAADIAGLKTNVTRGTIVIIIVLATQAFLLGVFLLGLLITVNPDLAEERAALVTPVVKFLLRPIWHWRRRPVRRDRGLKRLA